jgi:hypothetical protein
MFEIREVQDRVSKGGMFAYDSTIRSFFGYVKYIITNMIWYGGSTHRGFGTESGRRAGVS